MKIAVLIKQVPDTWGERHLDIETGRADRSGDVVVDEIDLKALEVALRIKDADKSTAVTVVTMGPHAALKGLRDALAMGADDAIHLVDDAFAGSDALQTARALAAAIGPRGFDLVIAGNEATDGRGAAVPAMLAELLGLPQLTFLRSLEVANGTLTGERLTDRGTADVRAALPAVISVTEQIAEARFPGFKGILSAKKKPVESLDAAALALPSDTIGADGAPSRVRSVTPRPPRSAGTVVTDDGSAAEQLAEFLVSRAFI
jgi:Electron transfer flavoprotein, beta subunit